MKETHNFASPGFLPKKLLDSSTVLILLNDFTSTQSALLLGVLTGPTSVFATDRENLGWGSLSPLALIACT